VDPLDEVLERDVVERLRAEERGARRPGTERTRRTVDHEAVRPCVGEAEQAVDLMSTLPLAPDLRVCLPRLLDEGVTGRRIHQLAGHADRPRGVDDVDGRAAVARLDPDRRVRPRGRGAADEERDPEALALELTGRYRHLLERRRDEPRQADDV